MQPPSKGVKSSVVEENNHQGKGGEKERDTRTSRSAISPSARKGTSVFSGAKISFSKQTTGRWYLLSPTCSRGWPNTTTTLCAQHATPSPSSSSASRTRAHPTTRRVKSAGIPRSRKRSAGWTSSWRLPTWRMSTMVEDLGPTSCFNSIRMITTLAAQ